MILTAQVHLVPFNGRHEQSMRKVHVLLVGVEVRTGRLRSGLAPCPTQGRMRDGRYKEEVSVRNDVLGAPL